ncbi:hypothetical protein [Modestobacter sp. NPDC049651]|uniref:hypothetical protein n=1 Tax=unclassified Modestobacter TaxID=2643866 RepID=UPI0033FC0978
MAPYHRPRVQAAARCVVDGLLVGGAEAAAELPPRSRPRALASAGVLTLAATDAVVRELPVLRETFRGLPPQPRPPGEQEAELAVAVRTLACGLVVAVADRPLTRVLRRRGVRRPRLVLGLLAALVTAAVTAPVHRRLAAVRAAERQSAADLDAELAQLLAEEAPSD